MNTVYLCQNDFESGTYRITQGGKYVFKTDVIFDPLFGESSVRPDTPINGFWFAAISVETKEPVIIDGNGHTLEESENYYNANLAGIYSDILLGNGSFSGSLFGASEARYPETSSYFAADNVTIRNLHFGLSSHFGIRGMNNTNVVIRKCRFQDCFIACVNLQGCQNYKIEHNYFKGTTRPNSVTAVDATLYLTRLVLFSLIQQGVPGAQEQLDLLNVFVAENPERFNRVQNYPSSLYGLFLNAGVTSVVPFPLTEETNAFTKALVDGRDTTDGIIRKNTFEDFICQADERVSIVSDTGQSIQLTLFGLSGTQPPPACL